MTASQPTAGPGGRATIWRVAWPSGTGTLWREHDDEQAAEADAARIVNAGSEFVVVYPIQSIEGAA